MTMPQIQSLYVYPIKACRGISLEKSQVDERGLKYDRQWVIIDGNSGAKLTQASHPKLSIIEPRIKNDELVISAPNMPSITLPINGIRTPTELIDWKEKALADDQGDDVSGWLSEFFKQKHLRLMRMKDDIHRGPNTRHYAFAFCAPFLAISKESLDDLNARMEKALPMDRFRPNIVISNCDPYAESKWSTFINDSISFTSHEPCVRCVYTTIDQKRGLKDGKDPLKTLATYRRNKDGVIFGQYYSHSGSGEIIVGDELKTF